MGSRESCEQFAIFAGSSGRTLDGGWRLVCSLRVPLQGGWAAAGLGGCWHGGRLLGGDLDAE